jgi:hypothetical protein
MTKLTGITLAERFLFRFSTGIRVMMLPRNNHCTVQLSFHSAGTWLTGMKVWNQGS